MRKPKSWILPETCFIYFFVLFIQKKTITPPRNSNKNIRFLKINDKMNVQTINTSLNSTSAHQRNHTARHSHLLFSVFRARAFMSPPVACTLSWWDEIQFMSFSFRSDSFLLISETVLSVAPTDLTAATCGHSPPSLLLFAPLLCHYLPALHLTHKHLDVFVTNVLFFFLFPFSSHLFYLIYLSPIGQRARCTYTWHSWSAFYSVPWAARWCSG